MYVAVYTIIACVLFATHVVAARIFEPDAPLKAKGVLWLAVAYALWPLFIVAAVLGTVAMLVFVFCFNWVNYGK